jgi:hypothetical protein
MWLRLWCLHATVMTDGLLDPDFGKLIHAYFFLLFFIYLFFIFWLLLQRLKHLGEEVDDDMEDEFYLKRLDSGLFTLQLIDYIMLEVCASGASSVSICLLVL